ncbi:MAG: type III secretion system outer membrane ring subunit SctC [Burkholderiaceae bacterium]|nr:type III secretion system outer membrane ring subunit SctC [Burkholderiaceae bacterium]
METHRSHPRIAASVRLERSGIVRLSRVLVCAALTAACWLPLASAETAPWSRAPYAYHVDGRTVSKVLEEFGKSFGVAVVIDAPPARTVLSGRISAETPDEFLDQIVNANGLSWHYYRGTVYVHSLAQTETRMVPIASNELASTRAALIQTGVFEPKFGWGPVPERGVVLVSGPTRYLDRVSAVLAGFPRQVRTSEIAVIRLKYAMVDDRVVSYRNQSLTIPGVATLLRQLLAVNSPRNAGGRDAGAVADKPQMRVSTDPDKAPVASSTSTPALPPLPPSMPRSDAPSGTRRLPGADAGPSGEQGPGPGGGTLAAPPAPPPGAIVGDSRLNAVVVRDTPETLELVRELVKTLDVPSVLIEIKAMILDINKKRLSELGVDWTLGGGSLLAGFGSTERPTGRSGPGTILAMTSSRLVASIRALEESGDVRISAEPSVVTIENLGAVLDLSSTFYASVNGERVANLVPVTTGTTLKVVPHLIDDGSRKVQLAVDVEDGSFGAIDGVNLPSVQQSNISTQAIVLENQSLLIGGYQYQSDTTNNSGVPRLSDLPVLGHLFKSKNRVVQDRVRMFLITPRILDGKELAPARQ